MTITSIRLVSESTLSLLRSLDISSSSSSFAFFVVWGVTLSPGQNIIHAQNAIEYLKFGQKRSTMNRVRKSTTGTATFIGSDSSSIFDIIVIPFQNIIDVSRPDAIVGVIGINRSISS